ncbi:MAG: LPS-assembly protein LptD [Prolixibacteraceae bacterium]|nr:LPS-assembly protein LptD [Prolixibacteraceae bacterium]
MAYIRNILILHLLIHLCTIAYTQNEGQVPLAIDSVAQKIISDTTIYPIDFQSGIDSLSIPDSLMAISDSLLQDSIKSQKTFIDSPIDYNSTDSMSISIEDGEQIVYLFGGADIKYGSIELTAEYIAVNFNKREIFASGIADSTGKLIGKPHFKEGQEEFDCETLRYNFESGKGFAENVVTEQQDGKVHSAKAKMLSKDIFCMADGKYSTCDAEHPHFYLNITKGKIVGKKAIIAGPSYLVLEDFPIYFPLLPYGYIPTFNKTYSSGIILPKYGEEKTWGFYLKDGGFYWAASDYFDVRITGDIYSKGTWGVNVNSRYKLRYKFSGSFGFNIKNNVTGEKGINQNVSKNFSIQWSHSQDAKANPSFKFSANVNFSTSGYDQMNEYDNHENYLTNSKSSSISLSKDFMGTPFRMSANLRHSQNSKDSTIALSLPEITFSMRTIYPFRSKNRVGKKKFWEDISFSYTMNMKNTIKTKESELFTTPLSEWQNGVNHSIPITLPSFRLFNHINFTPSINYRETWFFEHKEKYWVDGYFVTNNETGLQKWVSGHVQENTIDGFKRNYEFSGGVGASTILYGLYQMKNPNSKIQAIRHKMSPTIGFNYHPDFGDPAYGFYEWVQVDSLGNLQQYNIFEGGVYASTSRGESGSVSFGLNNNIEMKVLNDKDTTSTEKFKKIPIFDNIGFSGSYNLAADSMNLSTISLNARTKIAGTVLNINGTLDPYALDNRGNRTKEYMWNQATGLARLGRITNLGTGFGFNFSSDKMKKNREEKEKKAGKQGSEKKEGMLSENPSDEELQYQKFDMPWRFSFNYNISYTNYRGDPKINQTLSFNGGIDFTDKWKATFSSGFDLEAFKFTHTQVTVTRNLHCWSMSFDFSPFGLRPYYSFRISANASMLQDLMLEKKSYDFQ